MSIPRHITYVLTLDGHPEAVEVVTETARRFFAAVRSASDGRPRLFSATTTCALEQRDLERLAIRHVIAERGFEIHLPHAAVRLRRDLQSTAMLLVTEYNVARDVVGPTTSALCEHAVLHSIYSDAPYRLITEELAPSMPTYKFVMLDQRCKFLHMVTDFWACDLGLIHGAEAAGVTTRTVDDPFLEELIRNELGRGAKV